MFTIVGLGNPGEAYRETRHNVGWIVLAYVMEQNRFPKMIASQKCSGHISEGMLEGKETLILFPDTYMNKSGSAVKKCLNEGRDVSSLIVVYDEADLPLGSIRISVGRGSGGHNGLASIIDALGTKDFVRVRVGIASRSIFGNVKRPVGESLARHVLGTFKKHELKQVAEVSKKVDAALQTILRDGASNAMNEYNQQEK